MPNIYLCRAYRCFIPQLHEMEVSFNEIYICLWLWKRRGTTHVFKLKLGLIKRRWLYSRLPICWPLEHFPLPKRP
jgi:hypothetical protein